MRQRVLRLRAARQPAVRLHPKLSAALFRITFSSLVSVGLASKLCTSNAHVRGSWILRDAGDKSFACCGDKELDSEVCKSRGRMPYVDLRYGGKAVFSTAIEIGGLACGCQASGSPTSVSQAEQWEWQPAECKLPDWSARAFCKALGSRSILFAGDSMQAQLASTLMALVQAGFMDDPMAPGQINSTLLRARGACHDQLYFGRADTLLGKCMGNQAGQHFLNHVNAVNPDIVVVNAGAHVYDMVSIGGNCSSIRKVVTDDSAPLRAVTHIVDGVLGAIRGQATSTAGSPSLPPFSKKLPRKQPIYVWRSSSPAHDYCTAHAKPEWMS